MIRVPANGLPMMVLAVPLVAGGLQGPVRLHEKDGRTRASLKDCVAILEPLDVALPPPGPSKPVTIRTVGKQFQPRVSLATPGTEPSSGLTWKVRPCGCRSTMTYWPAGTVRQPVDP